MKQKCSSCNTIPKTTNSQWLKDKTRKYCGKELSDEEVNAIGNGDSSEDLEGFSIFLIKEADKDKIPLEINTSNYQYTPFGKTLQLELDISCYGEEFDVMVLEFFTNAEEALKFVVKNNIKCDFK